MSTRVLQRLIWKEYRTQRSLWLALLVAAVGIQLLMLMVSTGPNGGGIGGAMFAVGVLMAGFFALGSGAISFASEREDDTHIRLVSMTAPAGLTFFTKLVVGGLATFLFVIVVSFSAWVFAGNPSWPEAMGPDVPPLLVFLWANCLSALSWGILCSLFCRRVITALVVGGIAVTSSYTFISIIVAEALGVRGVDRHVMLVLCGLMSAMCVATWLVSYLVAVGWLRRDFASGPAIKPRWRFPRIRFVEVRKDGTIVVPIEAFSIDELPVLTPDLAVSQPTPRVIRRWLWWLFGGRGRQLFRFLVWRELVETRLVFWGCLLLLWVFNGSEYGGLPALWSEPVHSGMIREWVRTQGWFSHWLIALACGWMTFRREQTDRHFLLLTYRGTPSSTVWLSKQCVWLFRLMIAFILVHGVAMARCDWTHAADHVWVVSFFMAQTSQSFLAIFNLPIAMLGIFAVGQAFSLFVRRAVVSAFFAFIAAALLGCWIGLTCFAGVPLVLSTLPLAVCLMVASAMHCRPWMMELLGLRVIAKPIALSLLGVVGCVVGTSVFRATEIPVASAPLTQHANLYNSSSWTSESHEKQVARILSPLTTSEIETANRYRRLISEIKAVSDLADLKLELSADQLQFLVETAERPDCSFWDPQQLVLEKPDQQLSTDLSSLNYHLTQAAIKETQAEKGGAQRALRMYLAAFAMQRHRMGRAHPSRYVAFGDNWVLPGWLDWAARPDVTPELVDKAVARLIEIRNEMPTSEAFRVVHAAYMDKLLESDPTVWLWLPPEPVNDLDRHNPLAFASLQIGASFPGERERLKRLFAAVERERELINLEFEKGLRGSSSSLGSWARAELEDLRSDPAAVRLGGYPPPPWARSELEGNRFGPSIVRWYDSTPLAKKLIGFDNYSNRASNPFARQDIIWFEARFRMTILAMYLIVEHRGKEAPLGLELNRRVGIDLTDPWTGKPFAWFPDGLPASLGSSSIPVETPFLMSRGPESYELVLRRYGPRTEPPNADTTYYVDVAGTSASYPRFVVPTYVSLPRHTFKPRAEPVWKARIRD